MKIPFHLRTEYKEYLWFCINEGDSIHLSFRDWFEVLYWYEYQDNKD